MSLQTKIEEKLNQSLKNKDKNLYPTLRLIVSAMRDAVIANRTKEKKEIVKDDEIIKILRKMKKQRQDSANLYKKGERPDLLKVEEEEIKIIDSFLPKQLDEEQTIKICKEAMETLEVKSVKDMGKIMGFLKKKYSDAIDFSKVNIIIKDLLNKWNTQKNILMK